MRPGGETILLIAAAVIGVVVGLTAAGFRYALELSGQVFYGGLAPALSTLHPAAVALIPALGGLIVGPITYYLVREVKGSGVPHVIEAAALKQGRMGARVIPARIIAAALTIGSGGSAGREGPIVQIGSAVGSVVGWLMRLPAKRVTTLLACGASAGISATFNTPIAAVFFSLEIIVGKLTSRDFTFLVVSSVAASVVSHAVFGDTPAFIVPTYRLINPGELGFYMLLGIAAAVVARLFIRLLYATEDLFAHLEAFPGWARPALGGLLLGVMALNYPRLLGIGYETLEGALHYELPILLLLALLVLKLIGTSLTLGSGGSGGIFAPCLFLGAVAGGAFGQLVHGTFPSWTASPGAYALVGMAAVVAAATHTPITSVLIVFEMTRDYRIILPLMISVAIAVSLATFGNRYSIYTLGLKRRGIEVERGRDVDVLRRISVEEAMVEGVVTVAAGETLEQLVETMQACHHNRFPVLDAQGRLVGVITLDDVRSTPLERRLERRIEEVMTRDVVTVTPDSSLQSALRKLRDGQVPCLPVVSSENPQQLVGILTREDILEMYDRMTL